MIVKSFLLFFVFFTLGLEGSDHGYTFDWETKGWFKFHLIPKDWNDAMTQCELEGATLASPFTEELSFAIRKVMMETDIEIVDYIFHTGIYSNFSDGNLHSIEGENVSNIPVVLEKQNCIAWVMGVQNFSLRRVQCTEKHLYVCYKNVSIPRCGTDYLYNPPKYTYSLDGGRCYKFHRQGLTWDGANAKCQEEGAHLAVAHGFDDIMNLKTLFDNNPKSLIVGDSERNAAFVGIRKKLDGKSWRTIEGVPLTYTAFEWASTEPNNLRGDEYCGSFNRQGKLNDDSCQLILPYICEKIPTMEIISPIPTHKTPSDSNVV